jgi:peroxiredoxin
MIPRTISQTGILLIACILGSNLHANEIGLTVGEKAPLFQLMNQHGEVISLADLTAKHDKVALVFFRSADWCPFCKRQLMDLQKDLQSMKQAGITLVAISYDPVEVLDRFTKQNQIEYTLLSDPGSKTIDAYQIRNKDVRPGKAEGIPHPTIFLVNGKGIIAAKLREEGYKERPTIEAIVAAANSME